MRGQEIWFVLSLSISVALTDDNEKRKKFLESQIGFCVNKAIKPAQKVMPAPGGFVHCSDSIGHCIEDLLLCDMDEQSAKAGNISSQVRENRGFCGGIKVDWNPPADRKTLFYMARKWLLAMKKGFSLNITVIEFNLAFTESCMLDHISLRNALLGSGFGLLWDFKQWARLCGRRPLFDLYALFPLTVYMYMESAGKLFVKYNVMVAGNVRPLAEAEIQSYPAEENPATQKTPVGHFLKLFRENHYFWFLKGKITAHFEIEYTVTSNGSIPFFMTILDGPPVDKSWQRDRERAVLPETLFVNQDKRDTKTSSGDGFYFCKTFHMRFTSPVTRL